jgi:hypothetical protein
MKNLFIFSDLIQDYDSSNSHKTSNKKTWVRDNADTLFLPLFPKYLHRLQWNMTSATLHIKSVSYSCSGPDIVDGRGVLDRTTTYSGGDSFVSWPGDRLSRLRFFVAFFSPSMNMLR